MKIRFRMTMGAACAALLACGESDPSGSGDGDAGSDDDAPATTSGADDTSTGTASVGSTETSADDANDDFADTGPVTFDVGSIPDTPPVSCDGRGGKGGSTAGVELAYIWISNSQQNTISKIDTETMEEEGRYYAKEAGGDPSRTSVNLNGDVAVANRNGGVAKFYANVDDCQESNGQAGIQTSSGTNDILAWDEEECRAWNHPMACSSNRPVAWTRGEWSEATCQYEDAKLWTVCDSQVLLLNGETGETEQTVAIGAGAFVYGGAADADGVFWGLNFGNTSGIFRVDPEDYSVLEYPLPSSGAYGITVDKEGRPWVCSQTVARFNLDTSTWSVSPDNSGGGGCMTDGETTIWHGTGNSIVGFDTETLDLIHTIPVPSYVHGISVDFAGMVWGVEGSGSNAYRADPETNQVDTFGLLVGAYTYSDMTGFALSSAGGGGVPQN